MQKNIYKQGKSVTKEGLVLDKHVELSLNLTFQSCFLLLHMLSVGEEKKVKIV